MTTLAQACKAIVSAAINHAYLLECGEAGTARSLPNVYQSEYGYNGASPKACKDYLQGLPSVCTVPFYNGEILELLAAQGISRKTEDGQANLIDAYWLECGNQFYKLIK